MVGRIIDKRDELGLGLGCIRGYGVSGFRVY